MACNHRYICIYYFITYFTCSLIRHSTSKNFKSSSKSQSKRAYLMEKDNVSPEYELIYYAPMGLYITAAKSVSAITTILISSAAIYTAINPYTISTARFQSLGLVSQPSDVWYFSIGFIVVALIINIFVAKYPLRIYHSNERYIAVYDSQLPFRQFKHMFRQNEVRKAGGKLNPWSNCTYRLGNRTSLILDHYFRTPSDYNRMMGYN